MRDFGYVYFIQAGEGGRIKIGSSMNPLSRLNTLQTGCPQRLELLGVIADYLPREREISLQNRFKTEQIIGEWFNPSSPVLRFIEQNTLSWYYAEQLTPEEFQHQLGFQQGRCAVLKTIKEKFLDSDQSLIKFCMATRIYLEEILSA
jgi:Meiotically up-regulated gene 113